MSKHQSTALFQALSRTRVATFSHLTLSAAFGIALGACGSVEGIDDLNGTGGTFGSGGALGTGGTSTGGTSSTGGGSSTGGRSSSTGGETSTGGSGGTQGGSGGGGPTGGAPGTGGSASETCQIGTTMGNEVLFIGESFVQASTIPEETTNLARAAGSLGPSDSYGDKSVSGTWIGNGASNSIPNQYLSNSDGVRFVLMNGGGNDCWQGGAEQDRTNALNAATQLFKDMGENGVEKVVYFFYPDPIGGSFANLTACLDLLRPDMKAICDA